MSFSNARGSLVVGLSTICIFLAAVSLCAIQMENFADDPGVGWHLRTGEWVLLERQVPRTDPFLAAPSPRPWVSDQWLSDVLLWRLFQFGDWPLLYGALTIVSLVTFFGVLWSLRRYAAFAVSPLAMLIGVLVAFKLSQIHFLLRPVMFSFFFFSALQVLTALCRRHDAVWRTAGLTGLLFAVWCNLHPAFVLGLVFLGCQVIGGALSLIFRRSSASDLRRITAISLAGALGTLVNPYGLGLHDSILALGSSDYFMSLHDEWQPLTLGTPEGNWAFFALLVIISGLAVNRELLWRLGPGQIIACLCTYALSLDAVRVVPFFGIVAALPVAASLDALGQKASARGGRALRRISTAFQWLNEREERAVPSTFVLAGMSLLIAGSVLIKGEVPFYRGVFGPSEKRYPFDALAAIQADAEIGAETAPAVVVAPPHWGGFISFYGYPHLRAVVDDRNTLLGEAFMRDIYNTLDTGQGWPGLMKQFSADYVLLPAASPLARKLELESEMAATLFKNERAAVYKLGH